MNGAEEQKPLGVVLDAILFENKILLLKHEKRLYKDQWGFPGGKINFGETLKEAAVREAREETGLDCEFVALRGISSEIITPQDNAKEKQHFLLFVVQLKPKQLQLTRSIEGEVEWFDLDKLPEKMIPSDSLMLKEFVVSNQRSLPMHDIFVRKDGRDYFVEAFHA
ncbi:MAG: NUDIX domain-containing protein [Candidatus Norongarragalinales archaeon]